MIINKTNLVVFSATGSTMKIAKSICCGLGTPKYEIINITSHNEEGDLQISSDELVVFGVPVFSGRVPEVAKQRIEKIKGCRTPAIIVCVYGNREFDDALIELKDIVESNCFFVISAGAFIAQHSIFPKVAKGRPDEADLEVAKSFGAETIKRLKEQTFGKDIVVQGNIPYRDVKPIPLTPEISGDCNLCGLCALECPTQAINKDNPINIDKSKCISCAHCIYVCPKKSRRFKGLLYDLVAFKFQLKNSQRKEPYTVYR